ncbi:MAG: hypothetical protein KJ626_04155, partial [Verrucomicrobia bacterium]|nr:hypothetical protein [Verrucomicrobiota bacterium]
MRTRTYRWITGCLLMLMMAGAAIADIQQVGAVTDIQIVTDSETGQKKAVCSLATGGAVEVAPFAPDVFRVRFHWAGLFEMDEISIAKPRAEWPGSISEFVDNGNTFTIETPEMIAEIVRTPNFQVHFKDADGYYLLRDDRTEFNPDYHPVNDPSYVDIQRTQAWPQGFKLKAVKEMPGNEVYFGFGEYPGPLNRRGRTIQGWNTDTFAWGEFQNPMYMSLPFFYGVQGWTEDHPPFAYGVFFNNPARPTFKMGSERGDQYSFEAGDGQLDYFFFGGGEDHTMKKVLSRYSELTGRAYMLPKWALGFHQSRHSYRNQDWVEWLADEFRNQDIPCDAIYLDIGTQERSGQQHQLTFNTNFTDVAGMISYCENKGINLVPLVEPCLTLEDPMYGEAEAGLHFAKDRYLNTYVGENFLGNVSWLDFSSSATREWWKGKLVDYLNDYPFPAIWNDLNEPNEANMPLDLIWYMDGRFGGGLETEDSRKWNQNVKNTFCVRECEVTHQALREKSPDKRPFVLSRAGWPGIQCYATGWSGDNVASYDHLRHNIPLGVSVMISGQANFGHDVGGFMGDSWGDLLTRWTQWGSLNPVFRNHNIDTTNPQEPWVFGSPYTEYIRDAIKFRYKLMPYIYTLAHESTVTGIPMNTPTVFHFMYDTETHYQNDYEFMVGDYLLAAPVYESNASDRWLYLPSGVEWYKWQDDSKTTGGGWVNVSAPQGTLPLFVRSGAIIPMGPAMSHVNEYQPEYVDVHV